MAALCARTAAARLPRHSLQHMTAVRRSATVQPMRRSAPARPMAVQFSSTQQQQAADARAKLCSYDSDISIICSGGERLQAHRALLRMASPVWRGLIDDATESSDRLFEIAAPEDSAELMELLLCRVYPVSPQIDIHWGNMEKLGRLAHKHQVGCVMSVCKAFLEQRLAMELLGCHSATYDKDWRDNPSWSDVRQEATHWLQLCDAWGMHDVADKCVEQLLDRRTSLQTHREGMALREQLAGDEFLAALSAHTVCKVVKVMAKA